MGNCLQKPAIDLSNTNESPTPAVDPMMENRVAMTSKTATSNLRVFTLVELWSATMGLREDTMVGESEFGPVFKGWVDKKTYAPSKVDVGIPVAVKLSNSDSIMGLKKWQANVKFLDKFNHPNLVKLLGYCWEDTSFLLVYEYMEKGNLKNHLFRKDAEPLPWNTRIKIAKGVAKGLAFLHRTGVITLYRDFKSSNILLDKDFNAKLSCFGHANLRLANYDNRFESGFLAEYDFSLENLGAGNGHAPTVVNDFYYATPEYITVNHLYVKKNVYNFGVVLLEIITGLQALDANRPISQHNLVKWAQLVLPDKERLQEIIDPRLENNYPSKGAIKASKLILRCLEDDPEKRPSIKKVLANLKHISNIKTKSKESKG